jgi:predicted metal-dependent phosphoesterase TrpH
MEPARRFVDLHTHSVASDGALTPAALVQLADAVNLAAVALTDHDTTGGIAEARAAAAKCPNLKFLPGVELSARYSPGTMHILGLGVDENNPSLRRTMEYLVSARNERNPMIVKRLRELGVGMDMDDVLAVAGERPAGGVLGRLHIAEAMRRKGFVRTTHEAFQKYLSAGRPAFIDKERLAPSQAIAAIRDAGGAAVLAHPVQLRYENYAQLQRVLHDLKDSGLDGIEAYHSDHSPEQTRLFLDYARKMGLCVSGGSDFHGDAKPDVRIARPRVPLAAMTGKLAQLLGY